jgi:hypothetical protein
VAGLALPLAIHFDGVGHPQPADMSLDFVIDVDASGRVAEVGSDYIEILL